MSGVKRMTGAAALSAFLVMLSLGSPLAFGGEPNGDGNGKMRQVEQVLNENRDAIMAMPGVVGVGLSKCFTNPCIRVLASQEAPDLVPALEELLGDAIFVVVRTDPLRAEPSNLGVA